MTDLLQHSPVSRRDALRIGSIGLFGMLDLPALLKAESDARTHSAQVESVILVQHYGAPSQLDTWDPKPDAPDGIRGEFGTIDTSLPGYRVTEIMPNLAKLCDRFTIVRSMSHTIFNHNPGTYQAITGSNRVRDVVQFGAAATDAPGYGSVVARFLGSRGPVPPFVSLPHVAFDQVYRCPGQWGGVLGNRYDPFFITQDPDAPNFEVTDFHLPIGLDETRVFNRLKLMRTLDDRSRALDRMLERARVDTNYERAGSLLTSPQISAAFDLSREPDSVRDRYGRNKLGQSMLLSRRLVEHGVRFVTCFSGHSPGDPLGWDTHNDNFTRLKKTLMPPDDQGFAALILDLEERGMLDKTLVIWAGEFGRKPQIAEKGPTFVGQAGRDHWPQCYTIVMCGGNVKRGFLYGNSDVYAQYPGSLPTTPQDIAATLYHAMGLDPHATLIADEFGRQVPISEGRVLHELFV